MTNLATTLTTTAAEHPDRDALRVGGQGITYSRLLTMASAVAGTLRAHGVGPGDRVAVILPNVPAFPVVYWGVLLAGGIVVPMNPLLKAGEIDYFFTDSGASVAFVWPDFAGEATKGAQRSGTRVVDVRAAGPDRLRGRRPGRRADAARGRRHRDHPLHLGDDRAPEGGGADPPQHPPQRDALGDGDPGDPLRRRRHGLPAPLPRLRARRRPQRRDDRRGLPRPHPPLRPGGRDRGHREGAGHGDAGRADDVRGDPQPPAQRRDGRLEPADLCLRRARRCRSR